MTKELKKRIITSTVLIAIVMCGAILVVHLHDGWRGMEWQVLILSVCLLFTFKGNNL